MEKTNTKKTDLAGMIRMVKAEKNLTYSQIADRAGQSKGNLSTVIKNNTCKLKTLYRILAAMDEPLVITVGETHYELQ